MENQEDRINAGRARGSDESARSVRINYINDGVPRGSDESAISVHPQTSRTAKAFHRQRTQVYCPTSEPDTGYVSMVKCMAYGAPELGKGPLQLLISVHLLKFYQAQGATLGQLAFFTSIARCFDVLSDPFMANLSDATRSKFGRRRPYIFVGSFFYGALFVALCSPPEGSSTFVGTWFGIFYILFFLADTFTNVPHNALGQEVTTNTDQRRKLFTVAKLWEGVGTLCAAVLPAVLSMVFKGGCVLPAFCDAEAQAVECGAYLEPTCGAPDHPNVCVWKAPSTEPPSPAFCQNACSVQQAICQNEIQDGNQKAFLVVGLFFGCWVILTFIICVNVIRERTRDAIEISIRESKPSFGTRPTLDGPLGVIRAIREEAQNEALLDNDAEQAREPRPADSGGEAVQAARAQVQSESVHTAPEVEQETADNPTKVEEVLPNFISMMKNKPFRAMILPWILDTCLAAIIASMLPFYVTYVVSPGRYCLNPPMLLDTAFICSDTNLMSVALVGLLIAAICSMPMWFAIASRVGDYKTWIGFNIFNALTNILLVFPNFKWGNRNLLVVSTIIFAILNGIPMGAKFLTDNILGLCIDYDELRTGVRNEAAFTMFASFIPKIVSVPASSLPLSVLALIGFRAPLSSGEPDLFQDNGVLWGIRTMFALIPFSLACLSCFLKWKLFPLKDLNQADAQIKAGMLLRKEGKPYRDPLTQEFKVPPEDPPPAWRRTLILLNHFPDGTDWDVMSGIQQEPEGQRGNCLVARGRRQTYISVFFSLLFATGTGVTMALGLLSEAKWAWVPSLLVIMAGGGVLCSVISQLRLSAAKKLVQMGISNEVVEYVIALRSKKKSHEIDSRKVEEADEAAQAFEDMRVEQAEECTDVLFATRPSRPTLMSPNMSLRSRPTAARLPRQSEE